MKAWLRRWSSVFEIRMLNTIRRHSAYMSSSVPRRAGGECRRTPGSCGPRCLSRRACSSRIGTARVSLPPDQIGVARVPVCRRRFQVATREPEYPPSPRASGQPLPTGRYSPRLPCSETWQSGDGRRGPGPMLLDAHRRVMSRARVAAANPRRYLCRSRHARRPRAVVAALLTAESSSGRAPPETALLLFRQSEARPGAPSSSTIRGSRFRGRYAASVPRVRRAAARRGASKPGPIDQGRSRRWRRTAVYRTAYETDPALT